MFVGAHGLGLLQIWVWGKWTMDLSMDSYISLHKEQTPAFNLKLLLF